MGKDRRHNSDFHQETFKALCKDVGATAVGESSPRGDKGMNRSTAGDEDGERAARGDGANDGGREEARTRETRGEKEATAGTHPTFDLFK